MITPPVFHIHARRFHPKAGPWAECYCFDNEAMGLIAEPFVESASQAIADLATCLPDINEAPLAVDLSVSTSLEALDPQDDSTTSVWAHLIKVAPNQDGTDYKVLWIEDPKSAEWHYAHNFEPHTLWLCPVLQRYFGDAPERLFVQITPVPSSDV